MRRLLPLVVLLVNAAAASAQWTYGNEWVDFGKQYWKFELYANGVYRIDSAALAQSGFPQGVDPRHFMLFGREKEVPIYVHGEADGEFNTGDYIEFQADKNNGWIDGRLYPYPAANANPYYSLYNDTIRYFLTWDEVNPPQHIGPYSNSDFDSHTARPYLFTESVRSLTDYFFVGKIDPGMGGNVAVTPALMVESEGFAGNPIFATSESPNNYVDVPVHTPGAYTAADAPEARVTAGLATQSSQGNGAFDHHFKVLYGSGFNLVGFDTTYAGTPAIHRTFNMPGTEVGYFSTFRYKEVHDLSPVPIFDPAYLDWIAPTYVKVRYARTPNIAEGVPARMWLPDEPGDPLARIAIHNLPGTPMLYSYGDSIRRIVPTLYAGYWNALIPADANNDSTRFYLFMQEGIMPITALRPVNGTGYFTDFAALDVDSAMLIVAHESLMDGATQYANYRQNESANQHNTLLVDVDHLYDQFGGGVPKNAGAIRMWCKFLLDNWSTDPRALFLVGKSVNTWPAFFTGLPSYRPDGGGAYARTLVPSFGYPSSDQCFTTGLNFDNRRMDIPVGRLSANTNQDVINYLDKVRATEEQVENEPALWQKNILHFAGGQSEPQVQQLSYFLDQYAGIAEQPSFGAHTALFPRMTSGVISPLQQALADSVREYIEHEDQGVTLMTFFAHAYASSFDITIDEPELYDWQGRHPMVIGNSCYIGNIHLNGSNSTSEDWVLEPGAGPIAFMATVDVGYISTLFNYTQRFYQSFGQINYGAGIGEHMKHAGLDFQVSSPTVVTQWAVQTFALQGDPTLTLNTHKLPDYAVSADEILFDPATVTADVDSFTVKVVVSNVGKAVNDAVNVELLRTNTGLGAGAVSYFATVDSVYLTDTAYFRIPTLGFTGGQGINTFNVKVDFEPDQVDELDDVINNVTNTTLFVTSGDLVPVYPYDFAIVPDEVTILKASTGDPVAPPRNYVFQIDTTDLFNSPIMESTMIQAPGGVVSWTPQSIYSINSAQDSTVFFWRCSIDSASSGNNYYNWYERSFQYLSGKRGWGQAHYYQFKKDDFASIVYDRPERDFDFYQGMRSMSAHVQGNVAGPGTEWKIELDPQEYNGCGPASWFVAAVDPATFEAWGTYGCADGGSPCFNEDHQFGNGNNGPACRARVEYSFHFAMNDQTQLLGLQNMLANEVPTGFHLLFYTWLYLDKNGMEANVPSLMSDLEGLTGDLLDFNAVPDSVPYIFYFQKGVPGTFQQMMGAAIDSEISLAVNVPSALSQGRITATDAGPATAWHALYWDEQPSDALDTTFISVFGVVGNNDVELMVLPSAQDSMPTLGALVSAQQYPTLRLKGDFTDGNPVGTKPAQMKRWQLIASPVPECAIHPPLGLYNGLNGWGEGQDASVAVAVQNISEFDMDSLLLEATVVHGGTRTRVHYRLNGPLPAGAWVMDTVRFNTLGFGGLNTLIIEANPVDTTTGAYHQLEQYHFNNIAQWQFDVEQDVENPILDVTFDGMHILDGDIVSARPEILVSLDDENTIRLLDSPQDTANFKVFLISPGEDIGTRVWFREGVNEVMQFVPAGGPENIARIHYRPRFDLDGVYCLVVQANDLSENISGDNDYKVCFEVINHSTITEVLNYPNPFTTSTRFVFTVTGSEPPTDMRIQILTVTGRVVRQVDSHELGPLRVGRNITEFAWDGTDEFGDRLARGVYLYRVIARLNDQDIEVRETEASPYFTKGFGKMYLLR